MERGLENEKTSDQDQGRRWTSEGKEGEKTRLLQTSSTLHFSDRKENLRTTFIKRPTIRERVPVEEEAPLFSLSFILNPCEERNLILL